MRWYSAPMNEELPTYTVVMGVFEMAHPYATSSTFIEKASVTVKAPSARAARDKVEQMYPDLVFQMVKVVS